MPEAIEATRLGHYRLKDVVKSEALKILTVPSTAITLGLTVVAGLLVTGLVTHHAEFRGPGFDPTQEALTGLIVAGLTGGVFGALLITAEYSSGTIRATLAAAPRRPLLLAAKISVTAVATLVFCELLSLTSFFLGEAILSGRGRSNGEPGVARCSACSVDDGRVHFSIGSDVVRFRPDLPQYGRSHRRIRRSGLRAPAGDARHIRTRGPLPAHQHSHQLDHGYGQPGFGWPEPAGFCGRRIVVDGPLCRSCTGCWSRPVRETRRLIKPGGEEGEVQVRIPHEWTEQTMRLVRLIGREPFAKRSWAELGYFLVSSALTCAGVFVVFTLGIVGLALTFLFVGILIFAGALRAARGFGRWQRSVAVRTLGEEIAEPEPFDPRPGLFGWLRASLGDRVAWRTVAYFLIKVPLTIFGVWFALSVWIEALLAIASPFTGGNGIGRFGFLGRLFAPGYGGAPGPDSPATLGCS